MTALVALLRESEDMNVSAEEDPLSATAKLWGLLLHPDDRQYNAQLMAAGVARYEQEASREAKEDKEKARQDRMKKRGMKR